MALHAVGYVPLADNLLLTRSQLHSAASACADESHCIRRSHPQLSAAACALQDLVSGACRAVLRLGGVPSAVRLSSDDSLCIIVTGEQAAVYDFGTARQTASLTGHTSAITDAAVSGDAASVLTVGEDATLRLWSAQTGAP
jgi:WD40 repeat protein